MVADDFNASPNAAHASIYDDDEPEPRAMVPDRAGVRDRPRLLAPPDAEPRPHPGRRLRLPGPRPRRLRPDRLRHGHPHMRRGARGPPGRAQRPDLGHPHGRGDPLPPRSPRTGRPAPRPWRRTSLAPQA